MSLRRNVRGLVVLGLIVFVAAVPAHATTYDISFDGATATDGTAIFQQTDPFATGTGNIKSFVQIGANTDVIDAYNTTVNHTLDNGSSDNFNHELLLTAVPLVTIDGVSYREFLLDVNQTGKSPLESLDDIQIYLSNTANQSIETFTGDLINLADADPIYRLDDGGDNHILLDYSLNTGSGSGDMFLYIPDSEFDVSTKQYVYLYSIFGKTEVANDGFEEWAIRKNVTEPPCSDTNPCPPPPVIPEPTSFLLMGGGLFGLLGFGSRRKYS